MTKVKSKAITELNVARFVEKLNERVRQVEENEDHEWVSRHGYLYNFRYHFDDGQFVVYDAFGMLDLFSDMDLARPIIDELCEKNGWYAEPVSCSCDFAFGEV